MRNTSIVAVNCFANQSCQLFLRFPRAYRVQSANNSRVYFPRNILPSPSNSCCMSNTTALLSRLRAASVAGAGSNSTVATNPRCLAFDDNDMLITVEQISGSPSYLDRYNPNTLTRIDHFALNGEATSMAYYQQKYYVGFVNNTISVFKRGAGNGSLIFITNINTGSSPAMNAVRDMIFLDNGQTLLVASADNNALYTFAVMNETRYQFKTPITGTSISPHGLFRVNDTFFYLATWTGASIYAYRYNPATFNLSATLLVNGAASGGAGSHVLVDDCNRLWFTNYDYGIFVYDVNGHNLGNLSMGSGYYFDIALRDNYVLFVSQFESDRIWRIDPRVTCDGD